MLRTPVFQVMNLREKLKLSVQIANEIAEPTEAETKNLLDEVSREGFDLLRVYRETS